MAEYLKENFIYIWLGWGLFGLVTFLFFKFNKNARLKRVVFPIVQIALTAAFLLFIWNVWEAEIGPFFFFMVGITLVIGVVNYRSVVFCDACGASSYTKSLKRPTECLSCGSKWV